MSSAAGAKTRKPKASTAPLVAAPAESTNKSQNLQVVRQPGKTEDRQFADLVTDGLATNAATAIAFGRQLYGEVSVTELVASLRDQGEAVNRGDLAQAERMLSAQAVALNTVFAEMTRRAALNMGEHIGAMETYMRLALKAQSQSRATVETLAAIKNPPVVFARQANINNGGQQQINNGSIGPLTRRATSTLNSAGEADSPPPPDLRKAFEGPGLTPSTNVSCKAR